MWESESSEACRYHRTEGASGGGIDVVETGRWGALGLAGVLSFCCIGLGTLAGGAALAGGGAAGVTAVSSETGGVAGIIVSGIATAIPLFVIGLLLRRRARQKAE